MKTFPIMNKITGKGYGFGCPASVPWEAAERIRSGALKNHSQDLETLARRGGLSPLEFWCAWTGESFFELKKLKAFPSEKTLVKLIVWCNEEYSDDAKTRRIHELEYTIRLAYTWTKQSDPQHVQHVLRNAVHAMDSRKDPLDIDQEHPNLPLETEP